MDTVANQEWLTIAETFFSTKCFDNLLEKETDHIEGFVRENEPTDVRRLSVVFGRQYQKKFHTGSFLFLSPNCKIDNFGKDVFMHEQGSGEKFVAAFFSRIRDNRRILISGLTIDGRTNEGAFEFHRKDNKIVLSGLPLIIPSIEGFDLPEVKDLKKLFDVYSVCVLKKEEHSCV